MPESAHHHGSEHGHAPPWGHDPGGWERPPGPFLRRRLFGFLLFLVIIGVLLGLMAGLAFTLVTRAGVEPWAWGVIVLVVLGLAGGRRFMGRAWRPVGELIDATARLGSGETGVRVSSRGPGPLRPVVSSFNRMAERLDQEDARRRRLLADLGHELRTPLTVLRGEIEALVDGVRPVDEHTLSSLLDDVDTLERLVEDLRTISLAEAGRLELYPEEMDLARVTAEAVESFEGLLADRRVDLVLDAPGPVVIEADVVRIRQIVWNLLTNAVRVMPDGGTVEVSVTGGTDGGRLTVSDTGPGIPADQLETVFDRFVKSADSAGSGLGLTIVRDLVEAHAGSVVAGNRPGGGAEFAVQFPAG